MSRPIRFSAQKQQERISRSQFCERLDEFGWIASRPDEDLGEDFLVHIYYQGQATGVTFHVQLKSITNLNERRKGDFLVYDEIKVKDLKHWEDFSFPVALVVWDVELREGRWALVEDVIADLDQQRPKWRKNKTKARVRLPWHNTTDDAGLVWLKQCIGYKVYPLIAKDRQLQIKNLELHYPDTVEGRATYAAFERFLKEGEAVTLKGKFIQEFETNEWWMRWFGSDNLIEIGFDPLPSTENFPVDILISARGKIAPISSVELKMTKAGREMATFSNKHQNTPLHFHFTIPKSGKEKKFTISIKLNNTGRHVSETRDIMRFLEAMAAGGTLTLTFLTLDNTSLAFPVPYTSDKAPDPRFLQLLDKLCAIQNEVDQLIPVPIEGFTGDDIHAINKLTSIIKLGKATTEAEELVFSEFKDEALDLILDIHRHEKPSRFRITSSDTHVKLLGLEIPTGRMTRYVTGKPEMSVAQFEDAIAKLKLGEYLAVKFVDVEVVEIFPDWFICEAKRLSQVLIENFEAEAVHLFGSLVWSDIHTPETDIDLAVSGLAPERYLEAMSYLERESNFPVDLVELEKVSDHLRQRILTEGKLLSEREPAITPG